MIRLLKAFADWLDRRFPPKVMINEETWNAVDRRLQFLEMRAQTAQKRIDLIDEIERRVSYLEQNSADLRDAIAVLKKQKEEARTVMNPKQAFIESGDLSLIK